MKLINILLVMIGGYYILKINKQADFIDQFLYPVTSEIPLLKEYMIPNKYLTLADAIQNFEGWYPGSRSYRNNNPGNMRWNFPVNPFPSKWIGAIGVDETNHVIFDTYANGRSALIYQISLAFDNKSSIYNNKMTLYEFFEKYAEGNQKQYAEYVAKQLGVPATTQLSQIV